mmetsp:Transcript_13219/g.38052  ORF Transcript_13219/g.38052 Transcript_13219/m.38052 type:complete len:82 (-) Transcript_13219:460-705(-)
MPCSLSMSSPCCARPRIAWRRHHRRQVYHAAFAQVDYGDRRLGWKVFDEPIAQMTWRMTDRLCELGRCAQAQLARAFAWSG